MEGEEVCQVLPDDLVEAIVARVPFPLIFKARGLSKSWLTRFSSIASLDDAKKKLLATSFQKQVGERSKIWKSFCPVCIGKGKSGLYLFGYDSASERWQEMPSLSFLPKNFLNRLNLRLEGPLLYSFPPMGSPPYKRGRTQIYVANILTRSWKEVSPYPNAGLCYVYFQRLVSDPSSESYKLIGLCQSCGLHIYDSKSGAWTSQWLALHMHINHSCSSAYLNGILYICSVHRPQNLLAYNVQDGTFDVFNISTFEGSDVMDNSEMWISSFNLVVCYSNLLMVLASTFSPLLAVVLKIDLGSRKLLKVNCGPPPRLDLYDYYFSLICDGESIFFEIDTECMETEVWDSVSYNLDLDVWTRFQVPSIFSVERSGKIHKTRSRARALRLEELEQQKVVEKTDNDWGALSFQTGLKPFVEV